MDSSTSAAQIVIDYDRFDNDATSLMLRTSSLTDSSTSATQIAVEYNGVDDGGGQLVEKLSKSCQKPQRPEKSPKAVG